MLVEDDLILRSYLDILDHIQPKDCYSFGVFYIPRETEASSLKSMTDLINFDVNSTQVTHSFVHFLSMLGSIVNVKDSHQAGNNYLYLNNLGDDFKDEKLIINEDDTNFVGLPF